jgi:pilus assembly protein CpaB
VTTARRRRRAILLLAAALACGGLAASRVQTRESQVEAAVGPLVPVVVTRADIAPGARLEPQQLAVRQVPERFAPRDALGAPDQVAGQRVAGGLAAGGYVTAGALQTTRGERDGRGGAAGGTTLRRGERSVEVAVAAGEALATAPPGTRVDVIVTTEPRSGAGAGGRAYLALQDVELLGARAVDAAGGGGAGAGSSDGAAAHATTTATLRVTLRQAIYLTAAQSFAREIRLLARAPGDKRSAPPLTVTAGGL